jgi:hypothetical protein
MCGFIDFWKKKIFTEPDERSEYHFFQKSINPHIYRIKRQQLFSSRFWIKKRIQCLSGEYTPAVDS